MAALEIACFSPESGLVADKAGASRIELCADHAAGGTTPPFEWLLRLKRCVGIPVFAMVRPRGGNFEYSEEEFEVMKRSIDKMKTTADGLVFGILHDGGVDVRRTSELVRRAHPLPCTFHRAFDETSNTEQALEDVIATGCQALLTSGGAASAVDGVGVLEVLVEKAAGRILVMPGGGVRSQNLARLQQKTRATGFHSSAMANGADLPDGEEIQHMVRVLSEEVDHAYRAL